MENGNTRAAILREAEALVNGPRAVEYGPAEVNMTKIGAGWSVILGAPVTAHDVSLCMAWLKLARITGEGQASRDSYADAAGYVAIAAELADV